MNARHVKLLRLPPRRFSHLNAHSTAALVEALQARELPRRP